MKTKFNVIGNPNFSVIFSIKLLIFLFAYILVIRTGYSQDYAQNINVAKPRLKKNSHLHSSNCNHHHVSDKNIIDNSGSDNRRYSNKRSKKVFDKWVLQEEKEGVKIFYKWLRGEEYMVVRVDNLSSYKKSVYFQPLIYCWQCIDNSSNEQMHVVVNALGSTNVKVSISCERPMDTDMKLEDLYIYND